jgi:hypothetical protein
MYDMLYDPYQLTNIVDDSAYLHVKMELREKLKIWIRNAEQKDVILKDDCAAGKAGH